MAKSKTSQKATPSCCDKPKEASSSPDKADASSPDSANKQESLAFRIPTISPVLSALLHSSCCWLPTLLDLTSIGSASVASIGHLKPIFAAITVWVLMDSFRREGATNRNVLRALMSGFLLILPMILNLSHPGASAETSGKSCH
ncbi:hypothetical protein VE01_05288 [Pseudogymnoascus verrucosus]|uniref:Uncharacterized protein n=1 Tax=Pseudogymnoascus verrucosus TaxID=342668 RepID=A0A1B8GL27_9PEZI|nr:uncharacterized protein VE01_05288 [Pseudogymnoascus verrucosus]OBT96539.1 hypothetical protein VE01_05288 [Pseudogymnoascus verrucosus]